MKIKKTIKMTRNEAIILNQVLANVMVTGMSINARKKLICLKVELGKIHRDAEEYKNKTIESHKPKNFEDIQTDGSDEGRMAFDTLLKELDARVAEIINPYSEEFVEISSEKIASDEFDKLTEVNDLTLAAYEFLNQKLL